MSLKEFIKKLTEELNEFFKDLKFRCIADYKDSAIVLLQETEYGHRRILINFILRYDYVRIVISMGVRFDEVEYLFHQASEFSDRSAENTTTIGCSLTRFAKEVEEITISRDEKDKEIENVAAKVQNHYGDYIQSFFQKYDNLEIINKELNQDLEKVSNIKFNLALRAKTSIVIASLLKDENYKNIIEFYRGKLEKLADGFYLPNFEKLVTVLENRKD